MSYDVAIVGAGIVGAACAASLSASGLRVLVLELHGIATGTTATGMGHIVLMDDSDAQLALTGYSRKLWNELASELPADAEYDHCGTIWVAADEQEMAEVRRKRSLYEKHGYDSEVLDEGSLRELDTHLYFMRELELVPASALERATELCDRTGAILEGLIRSIRRSSGPRR